MAQQKYIGWFHKGARALRVVARERGFEDAFPTDDDWYLCPLCLDVMLTANELGAGLTIEDVPPKSLGGGPLVLTCKECNNRAGTKFDAEARKEQRLRRFFSGEGEQPETATVDVDGTALRVEMHTTDRMDVVAKGVPRLNDPSILNRMEEHLRTLSEAGTTGFRVTVTPQIVYSPYRALLT